MNPRTQQTLLSVSRRLGVPLYLVGGPVRDLLLGRRCDDWDLASPRAERMAKTAARALRGRLVTLDERFRIYRVLLLHTRGENGQPVHFDFAELQGRTIEKDLSRRDFTVNAMALQLSDLGGAAWAGKIIDPFGGRRDLKSRTLRAVSLKAFLDDPLRLLRAFRFSAQFGLRIEPRTRRAILRLAPEIRRVARERIREEMLRLFSQPQAAPALLAMDQTKLLTQIFQELEAGRRVARAYYGRGGVIKHSLETVQNLEWLIAQIVSEYRGIGVSASRRHSHTPIRRHLAFLGDKKILENVYRYISENVGGFPRPAVLKLGGLLHDVGKPATAEVVRGRLRFFGHEDVGARMAKKMTEELRFSRQECQLTRLWVQNHMRPGNLAAAPTLTDKAMARFFRDLGEDGVGQILVSLGDHYTYLARSKWGKGMDPVETICRCLLESYYLRRESVLPPKVINGNVLMKKLRLKPGPLIGRLLNAVQDGQSEGRVQSAAEALAYARRQLPRLKKSLQSQ